ncbi:carbohydrate ABC transporter permease, partial [Micromonospora zhanjiangensis]
MLVLAGLQLIAPEIHEAAQLDGASAWRRLVSVTLPLVRPALLVAVLFRILDTLRMFDLPYVLIGPRKSSVETLSMLAQNEAANTRYGPAAAYAVVLFLYLFLVAVAFVKLLGVDRLGDAAERSRGRRRNPPRRPGRG